MAFTTKEFRGRSTSGNSLPGYTERRTDELFQKQLPDRLRSAAPVDCHMDVVKSGGLFGTKLPMLVITHPNPPSRFFSIGVIVNGNLVSFPLLGESKQNTAKNMGKRYDEFKYQQEISWQLDVTHAIEELFETYFSEL